MHVRHLLCRVVIITGLPSLPLSLLHQYGALLAENMVFTPCVYYDVQTVCKQPSVYKWMKSRAKFPLRHEVCPEGLTQKVIPSTGVQSLGVVDQKARLHC
ncbi:hypothetical protein VZT92_022399 [Zoarces viviparus]|uniref:Secreted protein n=1 Tax=Zoarces viviparus TaxID=48416 RepID=A0AAW1EAR2_ZOAVI